VESADNWEYDFKVKFPIEFTPELTRLLEQNDMYEFNPWTEPLIEKHPSKVFHYNFLDFKSDFKMFLDVHRTIFKKAA
jgi:hypothetical protein